MLYGTGGLRNSLVCERHRATGANTPAAGDPGPWDLGPAAGAGPCGPQPKGSAKMYACFAEHIAVHFGTYMCMYGYMHGLMYDSLYGPRHGPMCEPNPHRMFCCWGGRGPEPLRPQIAAAAAPSFFGDSNEKGMAGKSCSKLTQKQQGTLARMKDGSKAGS